MVRLGENELKTVEDLAGCTTDDLVGWTERKKEKGAEPVRHKGVLDGFEIGRKEAEDMILSARLVAGWIKPEDLIQPEPESEGEAGDEAGLDPSAGDDAVAEGRPGDDAAPRA
jgi:N utilization substance protein A